MRKFTGRKPNCRSHSTCSPTDAPGSRSGSFLASSSGDLLLRRPGSKATWAPTQKSGEHALSGPGKPSTTVVAHERDELALSRVRAVIGRARAHARAEKRRELALCRARERRRERRNGGEALHSGAWHTASMLCPSGSNTKPP